LQFYDFFIVNDGIDRRNSMLRPSYRRRSSTAARAAAQSRRNDTEETGIASSSKTTAENKSSTATPELSDPEESVENLTDALSTLRFVPPSVRFGKGRAGFAKREQNSD
jgi:hypothetical protein